jgi:3-isopropylmalate dehydratase large subunit
MAQTLIQKLVSRKVGRPVEPGEILELPVDLAWGSEMTLQYALDVLEASGCVGPRFDGAIRAHASRIMFPFDHLIPATDARSASLLVTLREFAQRHCIRVFDVGYDGGIQHRLFEERGLLYPGAVAVGADSHSCTYGALGAIATGIGSTDLAAVMLSGKVWLQVPRSIRVELRGSLPPFVAGKDIVLHLLGLLGVDGAAYQALELGGPGVAGLSMAARFTVANMAVEGGAKYGLFGVDEVTLDYLTKTVARDFPEEIRFSGASLEPFRGLDGDPDARYAKRIELELDQLEPMIALPYLPENVLGLHQLHHVLRHRDRFSGHALLAKRLEHILGRVDADGAIPIQQVFIGSCTNGRIEDLRVVAEVLEGKRVAKGVRTIIIPASQQVYRQALAEGLMEVFLQAGCYVESSSCGPCIGFKSGVLGRSETAVFTSNRNFYGRTGDKLSSVILASPAVAAASALAGRLAAPRPREQYYRDERELERRLAQHLELCQETILDLGARAGAATARRNEPARDSACALPAEDARRVWRFSDDLNTDLIMPARYCNITNPKEYKAFILQDADNQAFLEHYRARGHQLDGDILVAGKNFGSGSSRESAPMGIKEAGFSVVIATSFARIFFRNALNIGLPVLEVGEVAYEIEQGDRLCVDVESGRIENLTRGKVYQASPMGELQRSLYRVRGLMPLVKERVGQP